MLLTQNDKMKKSSKASGINIFNFGIVALKDSSGFMTCPNAGKCASGCYAQAGTFKFKNVVNAYETRLKMTRLPDFEALMIAEINLKLIQSRSKGLQCLIRIHDSGDFYSKDYTNKWFKIMSYFESQNDIKFYAYTKMVSQFKSMVVPNNLTLIYSFGGKEDHLIDCTKDRHSQVFQSEAELIAAGYSDASHNDTVAIGDSIRVGLVYHGQKSYNKTGWSMQ